MTSCLQGSATRAPLVASRGVGAASSGVRTPPASQSSLHRRGLHEQSLSRLSKGLGSSRARNKKLSWDGTRGPRGSRIQASILGLPDDAPFAFAIGLALISSGAPLLPGAGQKPRADEQATDDTKFGVMTAISLIPFFDWLAWVFAFVDDNDPRFLIYAAVYAAPFLKSGLNLNGDWLPVASVLACAAHVQLEYYASTRPSATSSLAERGEKSTPSLQEPRDPLELQRMKKAADKLAADWQEAAVVVERDEGSDEEEELRLEARRELERFDKRLKDDVKKQE